MKLTEEQKRLVENNLGLCVYHAKMLYDSYDQQYRYGLDLDDFISICQMELCRVIMRWNPERGELSAFYAACAKNAIRMFMREQRTLRHKALTMAESYDAQLPNGKSGREVYLDLLPAETPEPADEIIKAEMGKTAMRLFERVCNDREKAAITMACFGGRSQKEVGEFLGCSQGYTCRVLKKAKNKLRTAMAEVGYV